MEFDPNSNTIISILNNVLKNINEDITHLRIDFKKLNDIVVVLSVKIKETTSIKDELKQISSKVDSISSRIVELEKAKERLENLIVQVEKDNKSSDLISNLTAERKIQDINARIKVYDDVFPFLRKLLFAILILIGIILYVTKSYNEVVSIFAKFLAI